MWSELARCIWCAFAASALGKGLLGAEAGNLGMVVCFAQVGEHQDLRRAIKIFGEEARCGVV